jgi:hypothetical protein
MVVSLWMRSDGAALPSLYRRAISEWQEKEMKIAMKWVSSRMEWLIVIVLTVLCGVTPGITQQPAAQVQHGASHVSLPEAPKPVEDETVRDSPEFALAFGGQKPDQSPATAASPEQQQTSQKPVGTAAAPPEGAAGVTASRPAGAVIAPAKQRRARAILIRVGLLVGAGVAVGTVLALTRGTPSQPPQ